MLALHGSTGERQSTPMATRAHMPWREIVLLTRYHLRILGAWLFLLVPLGFLGFATLRWLQARNGGSEHLNQAIELSLFAIEPGAGLLAAMLGSSLLMNDALLEVSMATPTGIRGLAIWRAVLSLSVLLLCCVAYMAWSVGLGIEYVQPPGLLSLLLAWLAPVLFMVMLSLFCSLVARNAALGMTLAAIPLAGSLFLFRLLFPLRATHPFFVTYTYSAGGQVTPDWWANRLVLLGGALVFAAWSWWLLRREERLVTASH